MEELLVAITRGLVDQPDAVTVEVDQPDEEGGDRLIKSVNKKDLCIGTGPFLCCEFHTVKCLFCRSGR